MATNRIVKVVQAGDLHLGGGDRQADLVSHVQSPSQTQTQTHTQIQPQNQTNMHSENYSGNRFEERFRVFRRLLNFCQETKADILLLPGDFLEQDSLTQADLSRITTMLGELEEAHKIHVFITPGNHDPATPLSAYRNPQLWPDNVHVFISAQTVALPELGVSVTGAGFRSLYQRQSLLPEMIRDFEQAKAGDIAAEVIGASAATSAEVIGIEPATTDHNALDDCPIHLALVHGELRRGKVELYNPLDPAQLMQAPFHYVALAHVHAPDPEIQGEVGGCRFAYSGTIQGSSRKDEGERGCLLLTFTEHGLRESTFVPLAETIYLSQTLNLDLAEDQEQALSQLVGQLREAALAKATATAKAAATQIVWNLRVGGRSGGSYIPDEELLRAGLEAEGFQISGLTCETVPAADLQALAEEDSLRGLFYRRLARQLERTALEDRPVVEEALRLGIDAFRGRLV